MPALSADEISSQLRRHRPPSTAAWRLLRRRWSAQLFDEAPERVIGITAELVSKGSWDRLTAYELVAAHPGGIQSLTPAAIGRLARGLNDWPSVDTFGCCVAGPAWREGRLGSCYIDKWARSQDRWHRRLALVCTVALNVPARGGRGDARRTLQVCRQLVDDRDDMVIKALSWALRVLVRWDRDAVQRFVDRHGARLASRVIREVSTKLRTGRKSGRVQR